MSRFRRAAFGALALALVLAFVELLALGVHAVVFSGLFSFDAAQKERLRLEDSPGESVAFERPRDQDNDNNAQAIHPYLGYVLDPRRTPLWPVNEYGFLGELPPFPGDAGPGDAGPGDAAPADAGSGDAGESADTGAEPPVSFVVMGGSVAETLSTWGWVPSTTR